jgi:hypothetical protein
VLREARILAHGQIGRHGAGGSCVAFDVIFRPGSKPLIKINYFFRAKSSTDAAAWATMQLHLEEVTWQQHRA